MNNALTENPGRKLPSADWIAVGLGLLGLILSRFSGPFVGLIGLAVFGPSVLRELGLLKDCDEWTRGIMHRAGFHAALALALLVFLNRVLPFWAGPVPEGTSDPAMYFDNTLLRQALVMVFLVSYLIQYWGAPLGVSRILAGFAVILLVDMALRPIWGHSVGWFWIPAMGVVGLLFLLAWTASRWPRITGMVLLVFAMSLFGLALLTLDDVPRNAAVGLMTDQVLYLIAFGVTGLALLKAETGDKE